MEQGTTTVTDTKVYKSIHKIIAFSVLVSATKFYAVGRSVSKSKIIVLAIKASRNHVLFWTTYC